MIPTDRIVPFLVTAIIIILAPGPQVLFVVGRALAYGRRTALSTAAGGTLGAYVQAILVSLGLGTLVERSAIVYTSIKLVGAAYLVYLGVRAFRQRRELHADMTSENVESSGQRTASGMRAASDTKPVSDMKAARQGVLVGLTNPKAAVFFAAILPQFVDRSIGHVPLQMIVFATMFSSMALVSDSTWGLVAGTARDWFARSPRRLALVGGTGGLAMVGLGVGIAVTGRKD
ncbi:MAG TPA: LysE family translocator [Actinocrinis sp.]|uniref:LysE family translocator n=1 Tax=Actinocrinis sp. TaxID=1920516 RepID=UPI002DDC9103|nr:LysE family translocator [Actinocrinis sp.]HEV2345222.1 LysE family translocator [Actinocrinis sp.]